MPNGHTTRLVTALLLALACAAGRAAADEPPGGLFAPVWPPPPPAGDAPPPPAPDLNPWSEWERAESVPRKVHSQMAGEWGSLTANSVPGDANSPPPWEDPLYQRQWKTDGAWNRPVMGPVFVFGQFGGNGTEVAQQDTKLAGQTGVGCKWSPVQDAEFTVRGGPSVTYTDALRPDRVREKSEWLLEVQAHWPILGKIGLEYQGKAAPALTPLDHDWIDQDFGLAAPFGSNGKVRLGARHHWENVADPKASPDNTQLYFGLELAR